jgi:hypothetical protein
MMKNTITVQTMVNPPVEKVWEYWNKPEHIIGWAFASNDWEALAAENDLRVGGKFKTTIEAFKKELAPYKQEKGFVQFPLDKPIPYELVKKIVRYRVREILGEGK